MDNKNIVLRTSYIGPSLKKEKSFLIGFYSKKNMLVGLRGHTGTEFTLELAKKIHDLIKLDYVGVYHLIAKKRYLNLIYWL